MEKTSVGCLRRNGNERGENCDKGNEKENVKTGENGWGELMIKERGN